MTLTFLLVYATVFRNYTLALLGKPTCTQSLNTGNYVSDLRDFPCGRLYAVSVVVPSSFCRTTNAARLAWQCHVSAYCDVARRTIIEVLAVRPCCVSSSHCHDLFTVSSMQAVHALSRDPPRLSPVVLWHCLFFHHCHGRMILVLRRTVSSCIGRLGCFIHSR